MANEDSPQLVDERFWLARATKIVEEAAEKLDKGGERVAGAMAWFWGAYSTALPVALAFSPLEVSLAMALLAASPALALFVAYGLATWAALPVPIQFNVLMPADIKLAHEAVIKRKRWRLRFSVGFAGLASLLVLVVGTAFAIAERPHHDDLAITLANSEILVGGAVPVDGPVAVRVQAEAAPVAHAITAAKKHKIFQLAVPVATAKAYKVEVSWQDGARTIVIQQVLEAR